MKHGRGQKLLFLTAVFACALLLLAACKASPAETEMRPQNTTSVEELTAKTATASADPEPAQTPEPTPAPSPEPSPSPGQTPSPTPEPFVCFRLFGKVVSSTDERVEFVHVSIGDEGVATLREALPQLRACKYLLLDNCGISNEALAQLRDDFPQIKIVWRVWIEGLSFLTDVTVVHLANEIGPKFICDGNSGVLSYCTDMEYLDLGHNFLSNIDFCASMPHLRYLIMSYNYNLMDLSPLENCPELEMAEFYFCISLSDLSPLTACQKLKYLNVSATAVQDISPVYEIRSLERFYCIMNYLDPVSQQDEITAYLPDCWITFEQTVSINVGWSYDEPGVRADWYRMIYDIWRYNKEDWYFGYVPET